MSQPAENTEPQPDENEAKKSAPKKPSAKKKAAAKKSEVPPIANLIKVVEDSLPQDDDPLTVVWYPTDSITFDASTANGHPVLGGLPGGRIVEFAGMESTGKTTLSLHCAARQQREHDKVIVFLDFERAFHKQYAEFLGVNTLDITEDPVNGRFLYLQPDTMEAGLQSIMDLCDDPYWSKRIGMFIFDSIAAAPSELEKEDLTEHDALGIKARQYSRILSRFTQKIASTDAVMVFINQLRENPSAKPNQEKHTMPGGRALPFYASLIIWLVKAQAITRNKGRNPFTGAEETEVIGHFVNLRVKKNKLCGDSRHVPQIPIIQNMGVDNLWDAINRLKDLGGLIAAASGGWMTIPKELAGTVDDVKAQGIPALRATILQSPEVAANVIRSAEHLLRQSFAQLHEDRLAGRGMLDIEEAPPQPEG